LSANVTNALLLFLTTFTSYAARRDFLAEWHLGTPNATAQASLKVVAFAGIHQKSQMKKHA
jgi:hypothetical protein